MTDGVTVRHDNRYVMEGCYTCTIIIPVLQLHREARWSRYHDHFLPCGEQKGRKPQISRKRRRNGSMPKSLPLYAIARADNSVAADLTYCSELTNCVCLPEAIKGC